MLRSSFQLALIGVLACVGCESNKPRNESSLQLNEDRLTIYIPFNGEEEYDVLTMSLFRDATFRASLNSDSGESPRVPAWYGKDQAASTWMNADVVLKGPRVATYRLEHEPVCIEIRSRGKVGIYMLTNDKNASEMPKELKEVWSNLSGLTKW